MERKIEGGCHCGAVRYAITEVRASMVCHCRTCQRVAGAPVLAWVSVAADDYRVTKGEPAGYASSPGIARNFCAACGTQLTYARAPDEIDVTTASPFLAQSQHCVDQVWRRPAELFQVALRRLM